MVKIYYDSDVDSTLFYDDGIYRFAFKVDSIDPLYTDDIIYDVQRVVFENIGRSVKTRKSKGKLNFSFTTENGGLAEKCFKDSVELLKQWKVGQPATKTQAPQSVPSKTYPFKVGDEFVFYDDLLLNVIELSSKKITSIDSHFIEYEYFDDNGLKLSGRMYVDAFNNNVLNNVIIILPEVKYALNGDGDYFYYKENLYKFMASQGGDLDFSYYTKNK